jgi:hypothetical protein
MMNIRDIKVTSGLDDSLPKNARVAVLIHDFVQDEINIVSYVAKHPAHCKDREAVDVWMRVMKKRDIVETRNIIGEPIILIQSRLKKK